MLLLPQGSFTVILLLFLPVCLVTSQDSSDPDDLTFINKWAAIGDSYASGIGAGNVVNKGCSRYDSSYPNLVNVQLGKSTTDIDFTFLACSGAKTPAITDQANSLSGGQQMITISAGGNDAGLIDVLNDCVYRFKGPFSGDCDTTLTNVQNTIAGSDLDSSLDGLINAAKLKLASGGTIYYTGYAKFWDDTTNNCDSITWHIWLLFTKQYLTQARRTTMNNLVDAMNSKLQAAVQRAGDQVVFINYDPYVGSLNGRYCFPGVDEDKGNGANRDYLFFYEMKTSDTPFMPPDDDPYHDELRRRDTTLPVNETTDGEIGSWIQQTLEQYSNAQLNDDVANSDLDSSVAQEKNSLHKQRFKKRGPLTWTPRKPLQPRATKVPYGSGSVSGISGNGTAVSHSTGSKLSSTKSLKPTLNPSTSHSIIGTLATHASGSYRLHATQSVSNSSVWRNNPLNKTLSPSGTGGLNQTSNTNHTLGCSGNLYCNDTLGDDRDFFNPVSHAAIAGYFVPDSVGRVFHPQQAGHAMIANMILYTMAQRNAASLNVAFPPENLTDIGGSCPLPPSPACNGSSTDTWTSRDAAASAVSSFCSNYINIAGSAGKTTSATFNPNTLDYMSISIAWDDDDTIGEAQCNGWFDTVVDGCDIPGAGDSNAKHGGSIGFAANATLSIDPLVMQRIWDKGKATGQQCNGINNQQYVTQSTLAGNIQDFCKASAGQNIANSGSTFIKDYNAGTPDHVTLSTTWPTGPLNYEVFADECNYYLSTIMDGCDIPNGSSNPMNWKHGGSMKDNNGVAYNIAPNADRAPAPDKPLGNCTSWYKGLYATFDVYGGGWADSDFGQSAGGVLAQIRGCGAVTGWNFQYFDSPDSDGTEWHAWGKLPIGTRRCVGRAVPSSGGFSGGCGGNG